MFLDPTYTTYTGIEHHFFPKNIQLEEETHFEVYPNQLVMFHIDEMIKIDPEFKNLKFNGSSEEEQYWTEERQQTEFNQRWKNTPFENYGFSVHGFYTSIPANVIEEVFTQTSEQAYAYAAKHSNPQIVTIYGIDQ